MSEDSQFSKFSPAARQKRILSHQINQAKTNIFHFLQRKIVRLNIFRPPYARRPPPPPQFWHPGVSLKCQAHSPPSLSILYPFLILKYQSQLGGGLEEGANFY